VTVAPNSTKDSAVSPQVATLKAELKKTVNALGRSRVLLSSAEKYLASATAQYVDVSKLKEAAQNYEEASTRLDDEIMGLNKQRSELEQRIQEEEARSLSDTRRTIVVSVAVLLEHDSDIELTLGYCAFICSPRTLVY
jgi:predicted  nucleic acid-binding Zn-ribbon protein